MPAIFIRKPTQFPPDKPQYYVNSGIIGFSRIRNNILNKSVTGHRASEYQRRYFPFPVFER